MDVQQATAAMPKVDESATSLIFGRDAENPAVCVVDGYGIQITTRQAGWSSPTASAVSAESGPTTGPPTGCPAW